MTSEFDLIELIFESFPAPRGVEVGIGDDSAVLESGRFDLVAMDTLVEGVHFRRDWSSSEAIGWKALAVNISDIAAMGGVPGAFFLSLALPSPLEVQWVRGLLAGMKEAARELMPDGLVVSVAGGDTVATSGPAVVTITALGSSPEKGPILREGTKVGDRIVVLGELGLSAAGLAIARKPEVAASADYPVVWEAFQRPRPNIKAGIMLGLAGLPSAMIDISDGLLQDLGHLLKANQVGAYLESAKVAVHPELMALEAAGLGSAFEWIFAGGEDFQLLMTISPEKMVRFKELSDEEGWKIQELGEVRPLTEGLKVVDRDGVPIQLKSQGYTHFEAP